MRWWVEVVVLSAEIYTDLYIVNTVRSQISLTPARLARILASCSIKSSSEIWKLVNYKCINHLQTYIYTFCTIDIFEVALDSKCSDRSMKVKLSAA